MSIRGGYGKYFGEATGQPPLFTLRYVQQIAMTLNNDGRADFASNPFNGPAPTYDQAKALLCAFQPNPAAPTCNLRHSTANFTAPAVPSGRNSFEYSRAPSRVRPTPKCPSICSAG